MGYSQTLLEVEFSYLKGEHAFSFKPNYYQVPGSMKK